MITFTSEKDGSVPEEFKDFKQDIDHSISEPQYMKTKTHVEAKSNFKLAGQLKRNVKAFKKYKTHKP